MRKIVVVTGFIVVIFCILFAVQLYISNPYVNTSYPTPFVVTVDKGQITLSQKAPVHVLNNPIISFFRFFQGGVRIMLASWESEKPFVGSEQEIISQIHGERFDSTKPYLISGGHFSDMYVRNTGIFYNAVLDGCIPEDQSDWKNREKITTQTIVLQLALLQKVPVEPTTFSSLWPNVYVPVHVYTRASDTLYAMLYTLSAMQNPDTIEWMYADTSSCHMLQTKQVSVALLAKNKTNLLRLLNQYQHDVIDPTNGLVKKNITLSGARDGVFRQSSFYDNVISWATMKLAVQLELASLPDSYFVDWKKKIITAFWDEKDGLFLNDLSSDSIKNHTFSADEFIVLQTKFLDAKNVEDMRKLQKMISYVQKNTFDQPFPLRYAKKDDYAHLDFWTWLAVPMYMGESIWSHWGMEYIKALILTGDTQRAKHFLDIYTTNIEKYGGYPEVYDIQGNILKARLYKSILHTGWVINYEEVQGMLAAYKE